MAGRFTSPDWAEKPEAVPYSSLDNPQSLNLYTYVGNNPLSKTDADGHCWPFCLALAGGGTAALGGAEGGAELGAWAGPVGIGVGAVVGAGVGYLMYEQFHQDAAANAPAAPASGEESKPQSTSAPLPARSRVI